MSLYAVIYLGEPMRLYAAVCDLLEAWADYLRTDTLEHEFENADWANDD